MSNTDSELREELRALIMPDYLQAQTVVSPKVVEVIVEKKIDAYMALVAKQVALARLEEARLAYETADENFLAKDGTDIVADLFKRVKELERLRSK